MGKRKDNEFEEGIRIGCNVSTCAHNCIEDSTCRLDKIKVCRCVPTETGDADIDTACHSYKYVGTENTRTDNH